MSDRCDCVNRRAPKRPERSSGRARESADALRLHRGSKRVLGTVVRPPIAAIDHHRTHPVKPITSLPEGTRREAPSVSEASFPVDHHDLHDPSQREVLQAIVGQQDGNLLAGQECARGLDPIRAHADGAIRGTGQHDGFVPDQGRVAVGIDSLRPTRCAAPVTSADDADAEPTLPQFFGQPDHQRRLARAADRKISDHHDGHGQDRHRPDAPAVQQSPEIGDPPVAQGQRSQQPPPGTGLIPDPVQATRQVHSGILRRQGITLNRTASQFHAAG